MIAISRLGWLSTKPNSSAFPMRWSYRQVALTLGFAAVLVLAVLSIGDGSQIVSAAKGLWARPEYLAIFLLTYTVAFYLRAFAWRTLLPNSPGVARLFAILQIALLANHLFPTKVGELIRMGLLTRRGVPVGVAAGSTVLARLIDFVAVCLIALAVVPLAGGHFNALVGLLALPMAAILLAVLGCYVVASGKPLPLASRLPVRVAKVAHEARVCLATVSGVRLLAVFAVVVPSWLLEAGALWSVAQVVGVPLSLAVAVGATAFTIAFQGFQFTPGGLGVYEASLTGVLVLNGVDPAAALTLAVATHALKFAYSYLVGFPCVVAEGLSSFGPGIATQGLSVPNIPSWPSTLARLPYLFHQASHRAATWSGSGMVLATFAFLIVQPSSWALPGFWLSLLAGVTATAPLAALGRCHHLPVKLRPLLYAVPAIFFALFGLPSLVAGAIALLLSSFCSGIAVVLTSTPGGQGRPPLRGHISHQEPANIISFSGNSKYSAFNLWLVLLTQSIAAGGRDPLGVVLFGLAALLLLLFLRQWWLAHHPLPPPGPPPLGSVLAVLVPVHNEAATIASVIAGVRRSVAKESGFDTQVIVVDDGSTDGSGLIARAAGADLVICHPRRLGLGAALRTGLATAYRIGTGAVVYLDGDGEYDPSDIPSVAGPVLRGETDYVLGTRLPYAAPLMRPSRRLGNQLFTILVSLLCGRRLRDSQTGFRAFSARALANAEIVHDYNYAQVLTLDLLRKRMRLAQVPISYRTRRHGTSFIRYREYLRRVLPAILREVLAP